MIIKFFLSFKLQVRVFSRPDQLEKTKFALSTTIKVLEYYEKYFEINYPLEKLGNNKNMLNRIYSH